MKQHQKYEFVSSASLPTRWGQFTIHGFVETATEQEHVALSYGQWQSGDVIPIRIHSECLTGDALFSTRCDCGAQLEKALQNIVEQGKGVLLYLRQEGRGIGLLNKIRAYNLQDQGLDTVEANEHLGFDADLREYDMCKLMLDTLNVQRVNLMTNNPKKRTALEGMGIEVVSRTPIDHGITDDNRHYIRTKTEKLGHKFDSHLLK
ncbi:GTP cyclohydrolase II [Paraglaciecola agarilytica]|uniref:GTP cyclohydrolase-2 n=1 Tax=Paraglaciecola chathamensis TaxID=368405 RepID=A0ABS0WGH9_9ALTE|nr:MULTISPECIES: GTP cyclohydrolase II [Paraglaciecola]MBJ2137569.1 GTP cyclohydrolase II [Paraglaciecola chathamensis]MBU3019867.1 GTP cyclohydrolase II [Paraglaciecola agarilytica]MDO6840793.1 GTP cyclohydrolase II [Paraglaciecola chathamensis]